MCYPLPVRLGLNLYFHTLIDSTAYSDVKTLLNKPFFVKALKKLARFGQTFSVEAFHALVNQYCPKSEFFSYKGMYSR